MKKKEEFPHQIVVSPRVYIQLTGECPACWKKLEDKEVATSNVHTLCGSFLPDDWEEARAVYRQVCETRWKK